MWQLQISFRVSRINNAYFGKYLPNKTVKMRLESHKSKTIMTDRVLEGISLICTHRNPVFTRKGF